MIRHQEIGINLPAHLGARLAQRLNKALGIGVILKVWLTPVAAIQDVIHPEK